MTEVLPAEVQINAWTGEEAPRTALGSLADRWGARKKGIPHTQKPLPFPLPPDMREWNAPNVGYGVLLPEPEDPHLSDREKAAGIDAPPPVRALLDARPGTVVLRWHPKLTTRFLRRYYPHEKPEDPTIGLSDFGVTRQHLPKYVVIIGGPHAIPWDVQYALSTRHAVGRIPLSGDALGNYIDALLSGWHGTTTALDKALSWTVVHSPPDITTLMNTAIAKPLAQKLTPPPLTEFRQLGGDEATGATLLSALEEITPGLVVTSSHGRTWPLSDPAAMRATLGLPVDVSHADIPIRDLCGQMPAGSIWYAQACCSAGASGQSLYTGLLPKGSTALGTVEAVAGLGTMVAPAAQELLGRPHPVRAVLGHVEPTFSWTLQVPGTGQLLGRRIASALSSHLYAGEPLGFALSEYRADVGELHAQWANCYRKLAAGEDTLRPTLTRLRVAALDRQSLVLLGDPTVALPPIRLPTAPRLITSCVLVYACRPQLAALTHRRDGHRPLPHAFIRSVLRSTVLSHMPGHHCKGMRSNTRHEHCRATPPERCPKLRWGRLPPSEPGIRKPPGRPSWRLRWHRLEVGSGHHPWF